MPRPRRIADAAQGPRGRHGLRHAGALRASRQDAALRRRADRGRRRARRVGARGSRSARERAGPRAAARRPASRSRSARGASEAAELNAGFLLRVRRGPAAGDLKLATSLDGRIATASGESQWITGEAARADGHRLRATHDAILVGVGTVAGRRSRADLPPAGPATTARRCASCSTAGAPVARRRSWLRTRARTCRSWLLVHGGRAGRRARARLREQGVEVDRGRRRRLQAASMCRAPPRRSATRGSDPRAGRGRRRRSRPLPDGRPGRPPQRFRGAHRARRRRPLCGRRLWRSSRLDLAPRFRLVGRARARRRHAGNLASGGRKDRACSPASSPTSARSPRSSAGRPGRRPPLRDAHQHDMSPDRHRRLDRLLRLLPDRGREGQRTGSRSRSRARPCPRPRSATGRVGSRGQPGARRSSSATSWAAISSPAMSTASARSSR